VEDEVWESPNTNLGRLLLSFLELFGADFPYESAGISFKPGVGYFDKKAHGYFKAQTPHLLCLEDPLKHNVDLGVKSFAIDRVKSVFSEAFNEICNGLQDATNQSDANADGKSTRSSGNEEQDQFATLSRLFEPTPLPAAPRSLDRHKSRPRSEDLRFPRRRNYYGSNSRSCQQAASGRGYAHSNQW